MTIPLHIQEEISYHMDQINKLWKNAKLTLLIRNPDVEGDSSVVFTDDDPNFVMAELKKRFEKGKD